MVTVKDDRIYVRVSSDIKADFEMVAAYHGLTPSAMLHSFIVKTIHDARRESPQIFKRDKEEKNQTPETEKLDKVLTLDEAKAGNKKNKDKKKK